MPKNEISRACEPICHWRAVGYCLPPRGGTPYLFVWSRAADRVLTLRPGQIVGRAGLLSIVPDLRFWTGNYRVRKGRLDPDSADWDRATGDVIAECYRAGETSPPAGVLIRSPGRPRKAAGG